MPGRRGWVPPWDSRCRPTGAIARWRSSPAPYLPAWPDCTITRTWRSTGWRGPRRAAGVAEGLEVPPAPGRVLQNADDVLTARATESAPFALQVTMPVAQRERLVGRLTDAGAIEAEPAMLELARILAGWPRLGAEVDEKTIPQEVRFDEIGGVSYTKGCYTGQETVARLHFRGHANRALRGLLFNSEPP